MQRYGNCCLEEALTSGSKVPRVRVIFWRANITRHVTVARIGLCGGI